MIRDITAAQLYQTLRERLQWRWLGGSEAAQQRRLAANEVGARPALVGYLNLIHPNQVQVLGREELTYLDSLDAKTRWTTIAAMMDHQPLALALADGIAVPDDLLEAATETGTPLLASPLSSYLLVKFIQHHLSRALADNLTLHGVFMEVFTIGVLITGEAGCGKSELALELLTRGHRLIADDTPQFTQISPDFIDGTCPEVLQDCLEVRGLGILNVRQMFGDSAIKANKFLRLIVNLHVPEDSRDLGSIDRLHGDTASRRVMDLEIPQINIPVLAGRNLAVIVEAAVRDFMLKMKGYDATAAFIERHTSLLTSQE
ncbi:MAG: HPr(Ser) kinase/phosphatase [Wenzhouxiangellaceae bacterium]